MLTPKQAQEIKTGLEAGKSYSQIGLAVGVNKSKVERLNKVLKAGKFNEFLEKAEQFAAGKTPKGITKLPSPSTIANIRNLRAQGLRGPEISERLGVSAPMVYYYTSGKGAKATASTPGIRKSAARKLGKMEKLTKRIVALREKGMTLADISKKLHVPSGTVNYRLYGHDRPRRASVESKEQTNGSASSSNGSFAINRHELVGIAFAETERFIGILSERLGVPAKVLRPRLSELLGHTPVREEPRDGN